ncbi:hypothetical protein ccbrp13_51070 [Ktedonobacteria bacterium brp13]|nr:hypothetical protein ccbrp13_51070 [Ktedonobacteria bacterium brp13]
MQTVHKTCGKQHRLLFSLMTLLLLCLFILAGCGYSSDNNGQSSTTGNPGQGGITPAPPVAQPTKGGTTGTIVTGNPDGCPMATEYTADPVKANVVVTPSGSMTTVHAHVGDVIEIHMPFGESWSGPSSSQGNLSLQQPSGYGLKSDKSCVWRFTAQSTGTTALQFNSRPICKAGQMCPMYIAVVPVTVAVS